MGILDRIQTPPAEPQKKPLAKKNTREKKSTETFFEFDVEEFEKQKKISPCEICKSVFFWTSVYEDPKPKKAISENSREEKKSDDKKNESEKNEEGKNDAENDADPNLPSAGCRLGVGAADRLEFEFESESRFHCVDCDPPPNKALVGNYWGLFGLCDGRVVRVEVDERGKIEKGVS